MRPRTVLLAGIALLVVAQGLASFVLKPLRAQQVPAGEAYLALRPGEFAGTLMLGGFRGLASDLLWMRATSAKDARRFYESVALFQAISRIQPRFEQIWEYMAHDLAYNIAAEVDDEDGKWAWYLAGLEANVRGVRRNPGSERLLRHLAWMFHHKGDTFHDRVLAADWRPLLAPLLAEQERLLPADAAGDPLPAAGASNFRLSERIYRLALAVAEREGRRPPAFVRRMVPLAIEKDGNLHRNRGDHLVGLRRWVDALDAWRALRGWLAAPDRDARDAEDKAISQESVERNEGRLRRKVAALARQLAPDAETGAAAAAAVERGDDAALRMLLARDGWKDAARRGGIRWLDE